MLGVPKHAINAALAVGFVLVGACGAAGEEMTAPATAPASASREPAAFTVDRVASGLDRPTYVGAAPGDPGALWVLEQLGRVMRIEPATGARAVALDLTGAVGTRPEQGLLGIAFHPRFAENRRLFLHWSDITGDTRVAEWRATADGRAIEPEPVRELLFVDQPRENHNGGQLAFGLDGRLYLCLGDGGGANDPSGNAQDPDQLLGKVLAVDVDSRTPQWQVVAMGLRNPWRFSFDRALGDLWIADVGQDAVEEVSRVFLDPDLPVPNLGWPAFEGRTPLRGRSLAPAVSQRVVEPFVTYTHDDGCAVVGGFIYGGGSLPAMSRRYLYGDFCSGTLWSVPVQAGTTKAPARREQANVPQLTHIGEDSDGEIVFASASGSIFRAVPADS
jgi:glucose/arabinose dehydrogenase